MACADDYWRNDDDQPARRAGRRRQPVPVRLHPGVGQPARLRLSACTWTHIYTLPPLPPQKKHDHLLFLNNTHNRLTAFRPGLPSYRPVPEETFTHSHPSRSSDILYQLPSFTTIHRILFIQFTCLTVLFDNLSPGPLPLGLGPSTSYSMHFFTQSSSFRSTCPYHRSLFCCNTNAMSSISNLSLSAPYLEICLLA